MDLTHQRLQLWLLASILLKMEPANKLAAQIKGEAFRELDGYFSSTRRGRP